MDPMVELGLQQVPGDEPGGGKSSVAMLDFNCCGSMTATRMVARLHRHGLLALSHPQAACISGAVASDGIKKGKATSNGVGHYRVLRLVKFP